MSTGGECLISPHSREYPASVLEGNGHSYFALVFCRRGGARTAVLISCLSEWEIENWKDGRSSWIGMWCN